MLRYEQRAQPFCLHFILLFDAVGNLCVPIRRAHPAGSAWGNTVCTLVMDGRLLIPSCNHSLPLPPTISGTAARLWKAEIINCCFCCPCCSFLVTPHLGSKEALLRRAHVLFNPVRPFLIVFQTNNMEQNKTPLVQ